jgi:hypothetical protein
LNRNRNNFNKSLIRVHREIDGMVDNEQLEMIDMSTKLSGAIFRKAELEDSLKKVYSKVFEKMIEAELVGSYSMLEIFGDVGG